MKKIVLTEEDNGRARADGSAKPHWRTRPQMARRYAVSLRSFDNWIAEGRLPMYKIGRSVRFDPAECDAALNMFRIPATCLPK